MNENSHGEMKSRLKTGYIENEIGKSDQKESTNPELNVKCEKVCKLKRIRTINTWKQHRL